MWIIFKVVNTVDKVLHTINSLCTAVDEKKRWYPVLFHTIHSSYYYD